MFSPRDFSPPSNPTGPDLKKWISEILRQLNQPGSLGSVKDFTPTITFATPGDLAVVYSTREGMVVDFGPLQLVRFRLVTSTFTHTTAAGDFQITGNPIAAPANVMGYTTWQGITKANYTQVSPTISSGSSIINMTGSGSGQALATLSKNDFPTGGTVAFRGAVLITA